jgi:hypothetical protein
MSYLAVTCKNLSAHAQENPFHGFRIKLSESEINDLQIGNVRITCPRCETLASYQPADMLTVAEEPS